MSQFSVQHPMSVSQFAFVRSTNEVLHPPAQIAKLMIEIEQNARCIVNMPTDYTCTIKPLLTSPLKHAKSHYSLSSNPPRPSTPTSSPTKPKSRAGTPVAGRPSSAAGFHNADGDPRTFTFDHCLWSVDSSDEGYAGQEKLYDVLGQEFLQHSLEGYNCCIFACYKPLLRHLLIID